MGRGGFGINLVLYRNYSNALPFNYVRYANDSDDCKKNYKIYTVMSYKSIYQTSYSEINTTCNAKHCYVGNWLDIALYTLLSLQVGFKFKKII